MKEEFIHNKIESESITDEFKNLKDKKSDVGAVGRFLNKSFAKTPDKNSYPDTFSAIQEQLLGAQNIKDEAERLLQEAYGITYGDKYDKSIIDPVDRQDIDNLEKEILDCEEEINFLKDRLDKLADLRAN